ncbi:MAG: bile acid:sodium symporter family protein [Candidatus Auribacter fodinae]|jgi:BASS family bile acid:Na+ symporter|uniref:Bile acid:sodium symporter family protein n=1 Tax=Candidatus Auribacter fodinae TaxID=2093366 RepID=A0A3A4R090_9BACT|nr:MAG: bile acid:sodium symporter family protein [Candidatus Auribacter fodinae]
MLRNIIRFYTRYFAVFVVICGVIAYIKPAPFIALKPFMGSFFALTMFGIGIVLDSRDFIAIARHPFPVFVGTVAQFTIMPLGAWIAARLFGLPPAIALGLILTGSAPGAMASNVMCYVAGADTAYSVSLTTVSTLLTPLMTPGLTYLLAREYFHIDFSAIFLSVVQMVILPLIAGLALRYFLKSRINRIIDIFPAV